MLNNFTNWNLRKKLFSPIKNAKISLNSCRVFVSIYKNSTYFAFLIGENNFLRKLQLAKLFSIQFSVDWCYFFTILKQKIQKSLCITTKTCTRIKIFKCIYLDGENDSDGAEKTKNAQFFMIFPNISFFHMIVTVWPGPLRNHGIKIGLIN